MNGDILTNVNFDSLLTYHAEHGAAATVALFRFKVGVMPLLAGSAAVGLVLIWLLPLLR